MFILIKEVTSFRCCKSTGETYEKNKANSTFHCRTLCIKAL